MRTTFFLHKPFNEGKFVTMLNNKTWIICILDLVSVLLLSARTRILNNNNHRINEWNLVKSDCLKVKFWWCARNFRMINNWSIILAVVLVPQIVYSVDPLFTAFRMAFAFACMFYVPWLSSTLSIGLEKLLANIHLYALTT